jgi:hypothetical protein
MDTPVLKGYQLHRNFTRPHRALSGQTPSEAAGVGVQGRNKWLAMLTEAITREAMRSANP